MESYTIEEKKILVDAMESLLDGLAFDQWQRNFFDESKRDEERMKLESLRERLILEIDEKQTAHLKMRKQNKSDLYLEAVIIVLACSTLIKKFDKGIKKYKKIGYRDSEQKENIEEVLTVLYKYQAIIDSYGHNGLFGETVRLSITSAYEAEKELIKKAKHPFK